MRRVVTLILAAAVVVAAAWWIAALPGRVSLQVAGLAVETSTPVALLLGGAGLAMLYVLVRLLAGIVGLPGRLGRWSARRRREAGDAAVARALVTLAAAEGRPARAAAAKARRLLGDTPQTLLLAAEAARQDGDEAAAAAAYTAMLARPDAAFLGLRGLFRQAMARADWPEAQRLARQAEAARPGARWLREARLELAARTGDWKPALALAGSDAPMASLATAASEAAADAEEGLALARRAFRADPGFAPAAIAFARRLRAAGRTEKALGVLREAWAKQPHPALAEEALEGVAAPLDRVRAAAALVCQRADDAESHLLLGRLSLQADLPGEARRHARAATAAGLRDRRAWMLLADVEHGEDGDPAALREALRQAVLADPEPAWHCAACNGTQARWHPACPACHAVGSLAWRSRPRTDLMAVAAIPNG